MKVRVSLVLALAFFVAMLPLVTIVSATTVNVNGTLNASGTTTVNSTVTTTVSSSASSGLASTIFIDLGNWLSAFLDSVASLFSSIWTSTKAAL